MPATYANQPESNWDHSHALAVGDVLIDPDGQGPDVEVATVHPDGDVTAIEPDGTSWTWTEEEITGSLADGTLKTSDGLSHELATF